MDADRAAISSARPAFEVDGQASTALAGGLLRLAVADSVEGLARCEAEFGNWGVNNQGQLGHLWFDRQVLDFGKRLTIKLGADTVFEGLVSAIEGRFPPLAPPTVVLRAEDKLQALRMTRRTRCFDSVSDADLVHQIANDHGLQADVNLSGPTWKLVVQANQSDLAFLRQRMRVADADLMIDGGKLVAQARASRRTPALRLTQGGALRRFNVCADLAQQRTALGVGGWNVADKQALAEEATSSAVASETSGGDSGPQLLQSAFGERKDQVSHRLPFDQAGARAEAEAQLRLLARRFVRGHGEAEANSALRAGRTVDIDGLGPLFDGAYGITDTLLRFDAERGLRTEFGVERAWLGRP